MFGSKQMATNTYAQPVPPDESNAAISPDLKAGAGPVGKVEVKIHSDVLAAHAQFGGDLESMQKLYDWCSHDVLVRLVELTASYCHGSAEYWNDKDADVLIEMARRMAPCTEAAGANLYRMRAAT